MNRLLRALVLLTLGPAGAALALAEVQEARDNHFSTQSVVLVDLAPAAAYRILVKVPAWWDPGHTWSGSARNLSLDARAGGCFCERLSGGGSVRHATVIFAQPGQMLRLEGAMGPLQEMAATGVLTFTLAPDGPGTRITLSYRVTGHLTMETAKLARLVDQVLTGQLERLRDHANSKAAR